MCQKNKTPHPVILSKSLILGEVWLAKKGQILTLLALEVQRANFVQFKLEKLIKTKPIFLGVFSLRFLFATARPAPVRRSWGSHARCPGAAGAPAGDGRRGRSPCGASSARRAGRHTGLRRRRSGAVAAQPASAAAGPSRPAVRLAGRGGGRLRRCCPARAPWAASLPRRPWSFPCGCSWRPASPWGRPGSLTEGRRRLPRGDGRGLGREVGVSSGRSEPPRGERKGRGCPLGGLRAPPPAVNGPRAPN